MLRTLVRLLVNLFLVSSLSCILHFIFSVFAEILTAITQCYVPPGRGDIPAFTQPINAGTRFSDPGGMQG